MPCAIGVDAPEPRQWHFSQLKGLALLAGRKLLLADDSITIQKIVALTFADEGIQVVAVSNGAEAIEKLNEISPDVVLADVFMPRMTGYQVCEHIKQTEKLKDIPVMLLVGSFEPFDEVEARRVGADDILTKPFQSIRNLVDKVGALLGRATVSDRREVASNAVKASSVRQAASGARTTGEESQAEPVEEHRFTASEQEADTQELPPPELVPPPEEPMTTEELEITTADTQPLSPEIQRRTEQSKPAEVRVNETVLEPQTMHNSDTEPDHETSEGFGDALLDLGHFEPAAFVPADDVILDLDFDSAAPDIYSSPTVNVQTAVAADTPPESTAFVPNFIGEEIPYGEIQTSQSEFGEPSYNQEEAVSHVASSQTIAKTPWTAGESQQPEQMARPEWAPERPVAASSGDFGPGASGGLITLEQLSPEVLDAIAHRAVEQLSEKVVQEIAWEVVPQLAELMVKRMLEEHESQNK